MTVLLEFDATSVTNYFIGSYICSYKTNKEIFDVGTLYADNINQAEFYSAIIGLARLYKEQVRNVAVYGDSEFAINALYNIRVQGLSSKLKKQLGVYGVYTKRLVDSFDEISFSSIGRNANYRAHNVAEEARNEMLYGSKVPPKVWSISAEHFSRRSF